MLTLVSKRIYRFPSCATVIILAFALATSTGEAQETLVRNSDIIVSDGEVNFTNAWAGGFNSVQFSPIDLDLDGDEDLFTFERVGNRIAVFIQESDDPGVSDLRHTTAYDEVFPDMKDWALMRDLDCDGKPDLLTALSNGIKWYRNTSTPGNPSFELADPLISASYNLSGEPFDATLYCLNVDIPSIEDIDGDGDLDIFSWSDAATTIFYFKNMAVENGDCSQPEYICANRCYGKVAEASEDFTLFIGEEFICPFNVIDPRTFASEESTRSQHAGGIIFQIDLDQNGLLDIILSDVTDPTCTALLIEECPDGQDQAVSVHPNFPGDFMDATPVDLRVFPAGYYFDIDLDGVKDLLIAPNNTVGTEDNESVWYYRNNGQDDLPDFEFIKPNWLQETMLDFGRGAYPVPFDYNSDGLMDLVVSNKEYSEDVDEQPSQLALLENVGTADNPSFELVDLNWLNLPQYGVESVYPAFGDLDNDGDADMILGEEGGIMHFFRNEATGPVADLVLEIPSMTQQDGSSMDIGQFATPQLFDVDNDGTLDLLVGEKNGNVNFIENVGSAEEFAFVHQIDTIGDATASTFLGINGYSVPFLFLNDEGEQELLIGSETGAINYFTDVQGNFEGTFTLEEEQFMGIWEGTYAAPCLVDIDGDDDLDLFTGNRGGGLAFYSAEVVDIEDMQLPLQQGLTLYPNPTSGQITLDLGQPALRQINVYNTLGQMVFSSVHTNARPSFSVIDLAAGVYNVEVVDGNVRLVGRVIRR